ncbi:MAG: AI-2E family transporter [Bacilli bacterium]|nr:AI-2E family transporter [Bacilli bacterium]
MKEENRKLNTRKLNQMINTGSKLLKILYVLFIILLFYVLGLVLKDWKILVFIGKIFSIISPLFIGWFIAWLLNPLVRKIQEKGVKRGLSVTFAFVLLLLIIFLIVAFTLPSLATQISELVSSLPALVSSVQGWIDNIFLKISNLSLTNLDAVKASFMSSLTDMANSIQVGLPQFIVNLVSGTANGIGKIVLGLILGFYILYDFDKVSDGFISMIPKKSKKEVVNLMGKLNESLYSYISGTLWLSILLFVVSMIGFSIIGLNAPVLVAFVCVITNLIPYIGPFIGAAFAGVIGFTQGPVIGIATLIFIFIVQQLEGNILHPIVMSKKLNLSPIAIIVSLLVFEHLFGIVGMIIATPAVAIIKIIYVFLDEKYNFFEFDDQEVK